MCSWPYVYWHTIIMATNLRSCPQCVRYYQCDTQPTYRMCVSNQTQYYHKLGKVNGVLLTATEWFTARAILSSQTRVWIPEAVIGRARERLTDTAGTGVTITDTQVCLVFNSKAPIVCRLVFTVRTYVSRWTVITLGL